MRVLISWVGRSDFASTCEPRQADDVGPLWRLLRQEPFDKVYLLNDLGTYRGREGTLSIEQLRQRFIDQLQEAGRGCEIEVKEFPPQSNQYRAMLQTTDDAIKAIYNTHGQEASYHILLSPGPPSAGVALILASQTLGPETTLWATWRPQEGESGVERVDWPVHLTVDIADGGMHLPPSWMPETEALSLPSEAEEAFSKIVGDSQAIRLIKWMAYRISQTHDSVLLNGETGTGKELFAEAIHKASPRNKKPFIALNCAGIPESLLESECFGHKKGSFTGATSDKTGYFQAADGGTVLLDEIGDMPLALQAKLLRFLQEKTVRPVGGIEESLVDVRIIAATHQDLRKLIRTGKFREDLYYRVATHPLRLPPLRARGKDVSKLAAHLLKKVCDEYGVMKELDDGALLALERFRWPGNYRQLEQVIRRAVLFSSSHVIAAEQIGWTLEQDASFLPDRPVRDMTQREFVTRMAIDLDELIQRFNQSQLPMGPRSVNTTGQMTRHRLLEDFIKPFLHGRAVGITRGNFSQAGTLLGRGKLDSSKNDLAGYELIKPWIDQSAMDKESINDGGE